MLSQTPVQLRNLAGLSTEHKIIFFTSSSSALVGLWATSSSLHAGRLRGRYGAHLLHKDTAPLEDLKELDIPHQKTLLPCKEMNLTALELLPAAAEGAVFLPNACSTPRLCSASQVPAAVAFRTCHRLRKPREVFVPLSCQNRGQSIEEYLQTPARCNQQVWRWTSTLWDGCLEAAKG